MVDLPMRHVWTKKPRGQRLAEMVQLEEGQIHGCGTGLKNGLLVVGGWEKLSPGRVKTFKSVV